jgi:hypothetical protein
MKDKKIKRKLRLRKTTIAHLGVNGMNRVQGGDSNPCNFTLPDCPETAGCVQTPNCGSAPCVFTTPVCPETAGCVQTKELSCWSDCHTCLC